MITGEGKIDAQTMYGKTPIGVARTAKKYGVPVIAIAGNVARDSDIVLEQGIDAVFSIVPGVVPLTDAIEHAAEYVERLSKNIASLFKIAYGGKSSVIAMIQSDAKDNL